MGGPSADGLLEAEGAMGAEGQTGGTGEGTSSSRLGIGDGEEATPRSTSSTPTSQRPPNSGKQILTPELHSAPDSASTSPPSRVDSVRVYAVRDLCMEFITELGCADVTEDAAKVQEQAQVTEESGEVVLAFLSKGRLCGIASLLRDGPRQEKYKSHESDVEPDDDDGNDLWGIASLLADGPRQEKYKSHESDVEPDDDDGNDLWDESSNENGGAYEVSEEDKSQDDGDDWVAWEEDFAEEEKNVRASIFS